MPSINNFSIVLIAFNNKHELRTTLESLKSLNYPKDSFEVIVVDDGSTPPLRPEVGQDLNFTHQFTYIPRTNLSCRAKARNSGARLATNEYLVFIDGDQYINPELLTTYNAAINHNPRMTAFLGTRIDLKEWQSSYLLNDWNYEQLKKITRTQVDFRDYVRTYHENNFFEQPGGWVLFWSHNFAIKRKAYEQIGGFDEKFLGWGCEDVEFGYRLARNNMLFDFIENHVYHLYESNKFTPDKYMNSLRNLQYFYEKYKDIAILFKLGFYESLYISNDSDPNHEATLKAFALFNYRMKFLQEWGK